jgi:hypothetical protein
MVVKNGKLCFGKNIWSSLSFTISFFPGAIHEKHNFEYLKNPTVKVSKFGAMISIWKLFTVTFFGGN